MTSTTRKWHPIIKIAKNDRKSLDRLKNDKQQLKKGQRQEENKNTNKNELVWVQPRSKKISRV